MQAPQYNYLERKIIYTSFVIRGSPQYSWQTTAWEMGKEQQLLDAAAAGNLSKVEVSLQTYRSVLHSDPHRSSRRTRWLMRDPMPLSLGIFDFFTIMKPIRWLLQFPFFTSPAWHGLCCWAGLVHWFWLIILLLLPPYLRYLSPLCHGWHGETQVQQ